MAKVIREFLEDVSYAAQWRFIRAREHLEDPRYRNSAHALAHLYEFVSAGNDRVVSELSDALESIQHDPDALFLYAQEITYLLSTFGFGVSINVDPKSLDQQCHEFFDKVVTMIDKILCGSFVEEDYGTGVPTVIHVLLSPYDEHHITVAEEWPRESEHTRE